MRALGGERLEELRGLPDHSAELAELVGQEAGAPSLSWDAVNVPGLSPDYPQVHCNRDEVCVITTGMGHTNAASSLSESVTFREIA